MSYNDNMIVGAPNHFAWTYQASMSGFTPGVSVTPGASNAEGAWTNIATSANIANDVYGIWLWIMAGNTSGQAKNHLLDLGVDQAGGTSYTAVISNLVCGQSSSAQDGGRAFYFPLFIKAGSSVAVRIQGSNATAGTVRVAAKFFGKPTHPENIRAGSFSETIGTITNSNGVSFTPGNTGTEGSWVSLGTTVKNLWWWQVGVQIDNAATSNLTYHIDLAYGDGTNKHMLLENHRLMCTGTAERISNLEDFNCYGEVPAGSTIYIRGTCSGTSDTGFNGVAVGIGG